MSLPEIHSNTGPTILICKIIIIITLSVLKGEHYAGTTHTDPCAAWVGQSQGRHNTDVLALPSDNYPTDLNQLEGGTHEPIGGTHLLDQAA